MLETIFCMSWTFCIWPDAEATKLLDHPKQKPRRTGCLRQINTWRKVPLKVNVLRWWHFALPSLSLIFLRVTVTRPFSTENTGQQTLAMTLPTPPRFSLASYIHCCLLYIMSYITKQSSHIHRRLCLACLGSSDWRFSGWGTSPPVLGPCCECWKMSCVCHHQPCTWG